jgi:hypothetical protein
VLFEARREDGGQVERCEYRQTVADCEEGEGGERDGARRPCGAEELGEFVVFIEAECEVGSRGCEELGCSCGCGGRGFCVYGRGDGIDCVRCKVGAEVETL